MTKDQSTILKGVAILMMLWYHLFDEEQSGICYQISLACNPVPFFLIISGYGYSFKYLKGSLSFGNVLRKTLTLYAFYWFTMAIFVSVAHVMGKAGYPGSITDVVSNVIGYECTYNHETWFLFPYSLITLLSVLFLPKLFTLRPRLAVLLSVLYFVVYVAVHFLIDGMKENDPFAILKQQAFFLFLFFFYFSLGILLYRISNNGMKKRHYNNVVLIFLLLLLVLGKIYYTGSAMFVRGIFAFAFIFIFIHMSIGAGLSAVLRKLGEYSLGMWLTHTYFSEYIFRPYILWSGYHVVTFLTLVVVSFITAWLLQNIWRMVVRHIAS